jgi:hypothetical protein
LDVPGIYRARHPERTVVDRIIRHLELTFAAENLSGALWLPSLHSLIDPRKDANRQDGHLSRLPRLPHVHEDTMFNEIPVQWDHSIPHALTIHLHPRHAPLAAFRVLDLDLVDRFTVTVAQVEAIPPPGDDRIQLHVIEV